MIDLLTEEFVISTAYKRVLGKKVKLVRHEGGSVFRAVLEGGVEMECTITNIDVDLPEEKPSKCFKGVDGEIVHVITMGDQACDCGERKLEYVTKEY